MRIFMTVMGERQGRFTGDDGERIEVFAFRRSGSSPTEGHRRAGRRQYSAVTFRKGFDGASPMFDYAFSTNERLSSVRFEFVRDGQDQPFNVIELSNASVTQLEQAVENGEDAETIALTFERFATLSTRDNRTFEDTTDAAAH